MPIFRHRAPRHSLSSPSGGGGRVAGALYTWSAADFDALIAECAKLGCTPEDMLLTMALETGNTFDPASAFRSSAGYPSAIGLNQITKVAADAMGITEAERLSLLDMTPAEQLPYVTRSFLAARGNKPFPTPPDAVTLYQTNIAPSTVGRDLVYPQKISPCPPANATNDPYCANPGLDADKDGQITRSDLAFKLDGFRKSSNYQRMVEMLHAHQADPVAGDVGGSTRSTGLHAPLPLLAGILAVGGYALYRVNK